MPFAIWLAFVKWDEDGGGTGFPWHFSHSFSHCLQHCLPRHPLDIRRAGGLIIAHFAVLLADKTREGVWGVFDERLIGRRFALLIDNPRLALRKIRKIIQRTVEPYRQASRKQTSVAIVTVLFLTTTILVYDATISHSTGRRGSTSRLPVRRMDDRY